MTSAEAGWLPVLDAMQRRVHLSERFLAGEDVTFDGCLVPAPFGPLPATLAGRAQALLDSTVRMQDEVEAAMRDLSSRLAGLRAAARERAGGGHRPAPTYVDRTA